MVSRVTAAVFGGYAMTVVVSVAVARLLPAPRAEAILSAVLLSFAVYVGAILWTFAARTALNAWLGVLATTLAGGALARLMG